MKEKKGLFNEGQQKRENLEFRKLAQRENWGEKRFNSVGIMGKREEKGVGFDFSVGSFIVKTIKNVMKKANLNQ